MRPHFAHESNRRVLIMKKKVLNSVKWLIAALCLGLIFYKIGISEVMKEAAGMAWWALAIGLGCGLTNRFLMAWRWYLLLKARELYTPYLDVVRIIFISNFVGLMVPVSVGVDAIRLYQIQRVQKDISNTSGSLVADRIISIFVLCLFSLLGILLSWNLLPDLHGQFRILIGIIALLLLAIYTVTAGWTYRIGTRLSDAILQRLDAVADRRKGLQKGAAGIRAIWDKITKFHGALSDLIQNPRSFLPVAGITILVQASRIAQFHFLLRGLGVSPAWMYEFAFIPLIILLSLLPISPMGLGIKEGAAVYFFGRIGIEPSPLVTASLFTHVITLLSITPGAYFFLAARSRSTDSAAEPSKDKDPEAPSEPVP
jgi:uncharacterized protein (TIRG00374 family)